MRIIKYDPQHQYSTAPHDAQSLYGQRRRCDGSIVSGVFADGCKAQSWWNCRSGNICLMARRRGCWKAEPRTFGLLVCAPKPRLVISRTVPLLHNSMTSGPVSRCSGLIHSHYWFTLWTSLSCASCPQNTCFGCDYPLTSHRLHSTNSTSARQPVNVTIVPWEKVP